MPLWIYCFSMVNINLICIDASDVWFWGNVKFCSFGATPPTSRGVEEDCPTLRLSHRSSLPIIDEGQDPYLLGCRTVPQQAFQDRLGPWFETGTTWRFWCFNRLYWNIKFLGHSKIGINSKVTFFFMKLLCFITYWKMYFKILSNF